MSDVQPPSFLASQAAKAKARAAAARAALRQPGQISPPAAPRQPVIELPADPTPQQPLAAPQTPPAPAKPAAKPASGPKAKAAGTKLTSIRGKTACVKVAPADPPEFETMDALQVTDFFRTHSPNAAAFEIAAPRLLAVMDAVMAGAVTRGPHGHQDRMTLFRMLGAPWTPTSSTRGESGAQVEALADRFVRAVARVERRLAGHDPVTDEGLMIEGSAVVAEDAA